MSHAIRFHKTGGPEVLQWEDVSLPQPAAGECLVRHKAVGLNYIDTYHRTGLYPVPLPSGIGLEAAGVVEAVGTGVSEFKAGDRVAYCNGPLGAYSELKIHPAERLVKIPEGISFEQAASMMLQGLTAQYLLRRLHLVPKAGDTILWQAAAGGVGLIGRAPSRADRRKVELRLSPKGRLVLAKLAGMHRAELERIGPVLRQLIADVFFFVNNAATPERKSR